MRWWVVKQPSYEFSNPDLKPDLMATYKNKYYLMAQRKGYFTKADVRRNVLSICPGPITE